MGESKCPLCGARRFYIKRPDDEYETFAFECNEGEVCFDPDLDESTIPDIDDETETFCNNCAWHDKLGKIRK